MKISLQWLRDLTGFSGSVEDLTRLLTMAGVEVEDVQTSGVAIERVVSARILASDPHPNADRLSVCRVDDGSGTPRQIVCGAKNYRAGDVVPLAQPGAVLPGGMKIKVGKLRGVESEGMLCSGGELGLEDSSGGLLILDPSTPVGRPLGGIFPADTILEIEVTPNRPDLLSYLGVAREVAALSGGAVQPPVFPEIPAVAAGGFVRLADPAGCPFYSARILRGVRVGPSPEWLAGRLRAAGLRPVNNIVDVTNFVLLETGQPLHAFDLARVEGGIVVRAAASGESLQALDGRTYDLPPGTLVIADHHRPLAVAGVMGGEASGVTSATTDILLESAWFEPSQVRRTARALGLHSDSSYRFERRVDPAGVLPASARAAALIAEVAGGSADPAVLVEGTLPAAGGEVGLRPDRLRRLLGGEVSETEIHRVLSSLGLTCTDPSPAGSRWRVPSFRPDLTREVDLIEEVARVTGLDRITGVVRALPAESSPADRKFDRLAALRLALRARGAHEVRTGHFVAAAALDRCLPGAAETAVRVRNPLGADQALLRPALLPALLEVMARNLRHGAAGVHLFETGRIFDAAGEHTALGVLLTGPVGTPSWRDSQSVPAGLHDLLGLLGAALGLEPRCQRAAGPGLCLDLHFGEAPGTLRLLPRELAARFEATQPVLYAEVRLDAWLARPADEVRAGALPRFPAVSRDLSVLMPLDVPYARLRDTVAAQASALLEELRLKDVFHDPSGARLPADRRSLTCTLTFRAPDRTLTSDEVDQAVDALRASLKQTGWADFRE